MGVRSHRFYMIMSKSYFGGNGLGVINIFISQNAFFTIKTNLSNITGY